MGVVKMILWCGEKYNLVHGTYNGDVYGYLVDGKLKDKQPYGTLIKGHIVTPQGIIIVLARNVILVFLLLGMAAIAAIICLLPQYEDVYYQVTFNPEPVLRDTILYCDVVNEDIFDVTVQFADEDNESMIYILRPGETLPCALVDFVPTIIRYNGQNEFPLEVQLD